MSRKRSPEGKFTVSGPLVDEHPVPTLGAGMSAAETFANRHRFEEEESTYYVRDLVGTAHARVTKEAGSRGVITTALI